MARKFFVHLLLFVSVLILLWFALTHISIRKIIRADKKIEQVEEKLGNWTLRFFKNEYGQINNQKLDSLLAAMMADLKEKNHFKKGEITYYFFISNDANAFALPGNKIVIFTGLIDFLQNEEELIGIVAHEIAHIEENHVIKKLSKEIGIATLFTLLSGSYSTDLVKEIARTITSTAYDRNLEREADRLAVEYMVNAGINPLGYVELLKRFGDELEKFPKELRWISTHPDSYERALMLEDLLETIVPDIKQRDSDNWKVFKNTLDTLQ